MKLHLAAPSIAIVVLAMSIGYLPVPAASSTDLASAGVPYVGPTYCALCSTCLVSTVHRSVVQASGGDVTGAHPCIDGACSHPQCSPEAQLTEDQYEAVENLLDGVLRGDSGALLALLRDFPDKAHLNHARRALQIEACDDDVIATHVPLSSALLDAAMADRATLALGE